MTGLVWKDTLTLTAPQWLCLLCVTGISLSWVTRAASVYRDALCAGLLLLSLRLTFDTVQIGIDVRTTWATLPILRGLQGDAFFSTLAFVNYLKLQPPLYAWLLSRLPWYGVQQSLAIVIGAGIWACAYRCRGRHFAFALVATPLFHVMTIQPSNDWWACGCLCVGVLTAQTGKRWVGMLWCCAACLLKYTSYLCLPFFLVLLRGWLVGVFLFMGGYWWWARHTNALWATRQAQFYLFQFTVGLWPPRPLPGLLRTVSRVSRWRWRTLGVGSLKANLWWLFPLYCQPLSWLVWLLFLGILLGYGNVKYGVLLFPVSLLRHGGFRGIRIRFP